MNMNTACDHCGDEISEESLYAGVYTVDDDYALAARVNIYWCKDCTIDDVLLLMNCNFAGVASTKHDFLNG